MIRMLYGEVLHTYVLLMYSSCCVSKLCWQHKVKDTEALGFTYKLSEGLKFTLCNRQ